MRPLEILQPPNLMIDWATWLLTWVEPRFVVEPNSCERSVINSLTIAEFTPAPIFIHTCSGRQSRWYPSHKHHSSDHSCLGRAVAHEIRIRILERSRGLWWVWGTCTLDGARNCSAHTCVWIQTLVPYTHRTWTACYRFLAWTRARDDQALRDRGEFSFRMTCLRDLRMPFNKLLPVTEKIYAHIDIKNQEKVHFG